MTVELHLGDCLEVLRTIEDGSVDAVITDPPYGARRPSAWRKAKDRFREVPGNKAVNADWLPSAYRALKSGGAMYLFTCWDRMEQWRQATKDAGLLVRSCIVWDKESHGLADVRTCWAPRHEMILFAAKGRHELRGGRPKDVIRCSRVPATQLVHPYQKPNGIVEPLVLASSEPDDVVLDLFAGSGTTGVACVNAGRSFIGVELDPTYHAIAARRIAAAQAATPLFDPVPA